MSGTFREKRVPRPGGVHRRIQIQNEVADNLSSAESTHGSAAKATPAVTFCMQVQTRSRALSAESWRLTAASTKLCLHAAGDETLPIVLAATGALGVLVAVWRLGLDLAPVVAPDQAAPIL